MERNGESSCKKDENAYKLGLHTGKRLCEILRIVLKEKHCAILFCLVGLISLLEQYLIYNIGIIPSGFFQLLSDKDLKGFIRHAIQSFLLILAMAFILSSKKYMTNVLYVLTRQTLTRDIQTAYFKWDNYFYINALGYNLTDNPDQRITQDIDKFSEKLSALTSPLIVAPFTIAYYSYVCFSTTGWIGPVTIMSVFIISAIINRLLIRPIMNLVILQEKCEGFFRFKHMHVRSNAEAIALHGGASAELARSELHFTTLVGTQQTLYLRQYPLDMSVALFDYVGSILSYMLLAIPVLSGQYNNLSPAELSSLISQNAFVTIYLISCFSSLIDISTTIGHIAGLTYRISELLNLVQNEGAFDKSHLKYNELNELNFKEADPVAFELQDITFTSPSKHIELVTKLNLTIALGSNLLITGNSSSGKTSLIRVIKGLWPVQSGIIRRHLPFTPSNIMFLPQAALLTDGSLLHQIIYPLEYSNVSIVSAKDEELILNYINYTDLSHLLLKAGGLNTNVLWNWTHVLSPGEAQRLSFVRLFYHRPKLAFLDEATSAVAVEMEQRLYEECKKLKISLVSVGHRASLSVYHDFQLHLSGYGNWTLTPTNG